MYSHLKSILMKNQNNNIVDQTQVLEEIANLVEVHFSNWPVALAQQSAMDILSKAASHPSIKEKPHIEWENDADTIIQQYDFNIKLIQLVSAIRPDIAHLLIPKPSHEQFTQ